jgi:hypothetical protein
MIRPRINRAHLNRDLYGLAPAPTFAKDAAAPHYPGAQFPAGFK